MGCGMVFPAPAGMNRRITTASQTFDVTSVINQNNGNRELLIKLVEVV